MSATLKCINPECRVVGDPVDVSTYPSYGRSFLKDDSQWRCGHCGGVRVEYEKERYVVTRHEIQEGDAMTVVFGEDEDGFEKRVGIARVNPARVGEVVWA